MSARSDQQEDLRARMALLSLSRIGPARWRWLLGHDEPRAALERLRQGRLDASLGPAPPGIDRDLVNKWIHQARTLDIDELLARHRALGIGIVNPAHSQWPFTDEPDPPLLVFHLGDLALAAHRPAVAVVGTRRCTTIGRTVAFDFGSDLASHGVAVVSGLALGVDGAAHRGSLRGGGIPIGVVGSGLDVVYPGAHRALWSEVAERGVLLSEAPVGSRPDRWRFPARNRLIASLSDGVVVVESHRRGGALSTADEASERGRPVFAVPGAVTSPASDGTNELLIDGAIPARHAADVIETLGIGGAVPAAVENGDAYRPTSPLEAVVLAESATGPVHIDRLALASGASIAEVFEAVQSLASAGRILLDGSTVSRPG